MTPALLLFDLDGTLTDPLEGFARSMNYALEYYGYPTRAPAAFARWIGPPIEGAFRALTGVESDAGLRALIAKYRERYAGQGYAENHPYPGIAEALENLGAAGIPMGVCTSKRADFAERILALFGLLGHFGFVSGGDVGIEKWRQIGTLRAQGRVGPGAIMVGDRDVDLLAAHRNGLAAAGVLWGYGSRAELSAHAPLYLFETPGELPQLARTKTAGAG